MSCRWMSVSAIGLPSEVGYSTARWDEVRRVVAIGSVSRVSVPQSISTAVGPSGPSPTRLPLSQGIEFPAEPLDLGFGLLSPRFGALLGRLRRAPGRRLLCGPLPRLQQPVAGRGIEEPKFEPI